MFITPEELLAGSETTFDIDIPLEILHPSVNGAAAPKKKAPQKMKLRPLTVRDVQLITKAAKDNEVLTSLLMIQQASVEPELKQKDIANMHSGLVRFLVDKINRISGLSTTEDELQAFAEAPLIRAFFALSQEFGWTPQQMKELTVGQILGYLEMMHRTKNIGT